jgi:L-ribulose-5-phosphate 4-epimerase
VTDYEKNTGLAIVRLIGSRDPLSCPAALVVGHAPFCWGASVTEAAKTAVIVEEIAAISFETITINAAARPLPDALRDKHHFRKHGPNAYYGQAKS